VTRSYQNSSYPLSETLHLSVKNPMRSSRTPIPSNLLDPLIAHGSFARPLQLGSLFGFPTHLVFQLLLLALNLFQFGLTLCICALLEPLLEFLRLFFKSLALFLFLFRVTTIFLELSPDFVGNAGVFLWQADVRVRAVVIIAARIAFWGSRRLGVGG
jgi:hypothetical protein